MYDKPGGGQTHSQSPEAMFTQVCGLRTVMPSNPYDAKGLLIAAGRRIIQAKNMPPTQIRAANTCRL